MKRTLGALVTAVVLTLSVSVATAQDTTTEATSDDSGSNGIWGLAGLLGLAGLAGLKRRDDDRNRRV